MLQTLENWDVRLLVFLNALGTENADFFWLFVTKIENWVWLYVIFLLLFVKYYKRKQASLLVLFT